MLEAGAREKGGSAMDDTTLMGCSRTRPHAIYEQGRHAYRPRKCGLCTNQAALSGYSLQDRTWKRNTTWPNIICYACDRATKTLDPIERLSDSGKKTDPNSRTQKCKIPPFCPSCRKSGGSPPLFYTISPSTHLADSLHTLHPPRAHAPHPSPRHPRHLPRHPLPLRVRFR